MSRGHIFKKFSFNYNGNAIEYEVRVDGDGTFSVDIDGEEFESPVLEDLKKLVRPLLEARHGLEYEPYIALFYKEAIDIHKSPDGIEEISFDFRAIWKSKTKVKAPRASWRRYDGDDCYMVADAKVDPKGEIVPMTEDDMRRAHADHNEDLIPFSTDRWRRLTGLKIAVAAARAELAIVLDDRTGKKFDEVRAPTLFFGARSAEAARQVRIARVKKARRR